MEAWASQYVGIPYVPLGRDRDGLDCWGLIYLAYREQYGVELPTYTDTHPDPADLEATAPVFEHERGIGWFDVNEPEPGDAVLFRIGRAPAHCGLLVGGARFIHAEHVAGAVVIEKLKSVKWNRRIVAYLRHGSRCVA